MKTHTSQFHLRAAGCGILFCLAAAPLIGADATPKPAGPPKVRVMVKENNVATTTGGGSGAATTAPAAAAKPAPGAKQAPAAAASAPSTDDAEKYTHTTKKSLTIAVVNLTGASMDVNVKTTFMAKDEAGKHEVIPETTVENKLTLEPTKAGEFTTEEVPFAHTSAHRQAMPKPAAGAKPYGKAPPAPMIPASGHAYFGYKVEVFQGNDLVGSAASENH